MSLILVNDTTNSKLKELKCDAAGLLMVDHVDVSALATEVTMSAMNTKITLCDTSNISGVVTVSAVSGDVACTHVSLPLPTGASSETTLSAMNGKITACDTGSLALDATVVTSNSHLSTLAGAVSAGVVQVSAGSVSASSSQVFGSAGGTATVADTTTSKSTAFDADSYKCITLFGNSTNLSDSEIQVEVSADNSNWFELNNAYVNLDYLSGDFGINMECAARYIRLSRTNTSGSSDSIKAWISGK